MKPSAIVNILLEGLPGADPATLDKIMSIITRAAQHARGNPARFEQEVNPLLAVYGIRFSSTDPELNSHGAPGRTDLEGVIMHTPYRVVSPRDLDFIREVLSHELVHADQISRAMLTGNAAKMVGSAYRRMLPQGKLGPLDRQAYEADPEEITAHARSLIDRMHSQGASRQDALGALRRQRISPHRDPKLRQRFLKNAAGYAQQLPER